MNAETCPRSLSEARVLVLRSLEQMALPIGDFFHRTVRNNKDSARKPHKLRVMLFNAAGVTQKELCDFETLVLMWVRNSSGALESLRGAAAELVDGNNHLSDLSSMARALAVEAALTRIFLERHGKHVLRLFRGLRLGRGAACMRARVEGKRAVFLQRHSCESHSTSLLVARAFGKTVLREDKVPAYRCLLCHKTNSTFFPHESEFVVLRESCSAAEAEVAIRSTHGFKERLVTLLFGGHVYSIRSNQI